MSELPLFDRRPAPEMTGADVACLVRCLAGRGWLTAKALKQAHVFGDRDLRAIANASKGTVISGQRGYCLLSEATVPEIQHAADWLRHQGREMIRRGNEIEHAMHVRRTTAA